MRKISCNALVASILFLTGCDLPGRPRKEDPPTDEQVFNKLYQLNCSGCHGADGKLGPAPPLNGPIFLAIVPEAEFVRVISGGRHDTLMPAFAKERGGALTDEQIDILARGIKKRWPAAKDLPPNLPAYLADENQVGDKDRGIKLFAQACAGCHGEKGDGGMHGAIRNPDFLALMSNQALRRIIITGRGDLGMPNCTESSERGEGFQPLSSQDVADLVALLAYWRQDGR